MNLNFYNLETSTATGGGAQSMIVMVIYLAVIFGAMYLLLIRPQRKKQKEEEKMRSNIQIGDEILTIGGFYARVISIKEDALIIESVSDHSKQKVARWAVQQNLTIHDEG